ncbi:MAG: PKD domain-containing protein [Bacteroidetes bacterium]|nr:PKD domain-containing protein [Bacteroidota bacterium]MBU1717526.1 PKD domain-containing protein [Bacteroidota bacterium]
MKNKRIEDFLRDSLEGYEHPYDPSEWDAFENKLPKAKQTWFQTPNVWYWIAGVASVLAVATWIVSDQMRSFRNENETVIMDSQKVRPDLSHIPAQTNDNVTEQTQPEVHKNSALPVVVENTQASSNSEKAISFVNSEKTVSEKTAVITKAETSPVNPDAGIQTTTDYNDESWFTKSGENPDANFTYSASSGCGSLTVKFTPKENGERYSYYWVFGDGTTSTNAIPDHYYTKSGRFSVSLTVTDNPTSNSATETYNNAIKVFEKPKAAFDKKITGFNKVQFVNLSKNAGSYSWSFGDGYNSSEYTPEHTYLSKGTYSVFLAVSNIEGCTDSITRLIEVESPEAIFSANAFTPNGDGVNDYIGPDGDYMDVITDYHWMIYDKNGVLVFETKDKNLQWDGRVRNTAEYAKQDVYTWVITYRDKEGNPKKYAGTINLLR